MKEFYRDLYKNYCVGDFGAGLVENGPELAGNSPKHPPNTFGALPPITDFVKNSNTSQKVHMSEKPMLEKDVRA